MATSRRRPPCARPQVEELEPRLVLSPAAQPTALDVEFLERLDDARANPAAYGASIGVDLSNVAPAQPLAWNTTLVAVATAHSQDMSSRAYFSHYTPEGLDLGARLTQAGFPWTSFSESIAAGFATPESALSALIADRGVANLGHRLHLLGIGPAYQGLNQVGVGVVTNGTGPYVNYYTVDSASTADTRPFLTGAVFNDANHNGLYDAGEGLAGVTIQVHGGPTVTDFDSGGYSIQLNPGTYTVTFTGGGLPAPITRTVTLGSQNVRLDVTPGLASSPTPTPGNPPSQPPPPAPAKPPAPATAPSASDYNNWVAQVGQDLLGRALQPGEVTNWVGYLQRGGTAAGVVSGLMATPDYARAQLTQWVAQTGHTLLWRSLSAQETSAWVNYLQAGGSRVTLVTSMMTANGDNGMSLSAWMSELSRALVQRGLTAMEMNAWVNYLAAGGSKQVAVATFLGSTQYQQVQLTSWLNQTAEAVLGRALQPQELGTWLPFLLQGGAQATVVASLVSQAAFTHQYLHT